MRPVFISYRRDDTEGQAGRLFQDLRAALGDDAVFMDVATIEPGVDFRRAIEKHTASCGALLALIGRQWLTLQGSDGRRRLDDPRDFVRLETATALRREIPVIPVLVQDARMVRAEELPDDMKELAFRNSVELTHARWESDVQLLIKALRPLVHGQSAAQPPVPSPATASTAARATGPRWLAPAVAALALGAAVAGAAGLWYGDRERAQALHAATLAAKEAKLTAQAAAAERAAMQQAEAARVAADKAADEKAAADRAAADKAVAERAAARKAAAEKAEADRIAAAKVAAEKAAAEKAAAEKLAAEQAAADKAAAERAAVERAAAERARLAALQQQRDAQARAASNGECVSGYVWRDAWPGDKVCVTPATRSRTAAENANATSTRQPGGGAYGPNTCRQGFVWREARSSDFVCVVPPSRDQARADNAAAMSRRVATPT